MDEEEEAVAVAAVVGVGVGEGEGEGAEVEEAVVEDEERDAAVAVDGAVPEAASGATITGLESLCALSFPPGLRRSSDSILATVPNTMNPAPTTKKRHCPPTARIRMTMRLVKYQRTPSPRKRLPKSRIAYFCSLW